MRISAGGRVRGTGFAIGPSDEVLTCHHVIDGCDEIEWRTPAGATGAATIEAAAPEADVALLRCAELRAAAIPMDEVQALPAPFWTKGFQSQSWSVEGALPLAGHMLGRLGHVRYRAASEYELEDVLALAGCVIDHGTSGAPVFDPDWGVAVATVNTRFVPDGAAAFALPLDRLRTLGAPFAELFAWNRRQVACYGPYLNACGARRICSALSESAVQELERIDVVLPERYIERGSGQLVTDFLAGERPMLAIVGPSSIGKTNEAAHIAMSDRHPDPALLLRARDFNDEDVARGLAAVLDKALQLSDAASRLPSYAPARRLASALASAGTPLVVLIDGLNEAPVSSPARWLDWAARTVPFAENERLRIIVTCRTEYWELIAADLPTRLFHEGRSTGHHLGYFGEEQAAHALERYELQDSGLTSADVKHPFLARIYWKLSLQGSGVAGLSRYKATQRYVEEAVRKVAGTVGLSRRVVHAVLQRAADVAQRRGEHLIDRRSLNDIAIDQPGVVSALFDENLLVTTQGGCRFAFDQTLEFIVAGQISEAELTSEDFLNDVGSARAPIAGAATFALLRIEREETAGELNRVLDTITEQLRRTDGREGLAYLLTEAFRSFDDLSSVIGALRRFLAVAVTRDVTVHDEVLELCRAIEVPVELKLSLLRAVAPIDRYSWDWENRDAFAERVRVSTILSPGRVASEIITTDRETAFRELTLWLVDRTPLWRRNTIADLAAGLLWMSRHHDPAALCSTVLDAAHCPSRLIEELARDLPEDMLGVCETIEATESEPQSKRLVTALSVLVELETRQVRDRALRVLARLASRGPAGGRDLALEVLENTPYEAREAALGYVDRFAAGDTNIPLSLVVDGLRSDFDRLLPAFRRRLLQERDGPMADDMLWALGTNVPRVGREINRVAELVAEVGNGDRDQRGHIPGRPPRGKRDGRSPASAGPSRNRGTAV